MVKMGISCLGHISSSSRSSECVPIVARALDPAAVQSLCRVLARANVSCIQGKALRTFEGKGGRGLKWPKICGRPLWTVLYIYFNK